MLQSIRSQITGWKAIAILLLIGLTFMFFGVTAGGISVNDWAAQVNGQKIPMQQFRGELQRREAQANQYYPDGIPDEIRTELRETILDGMIRQELVSQRVQDARFQVSDAEVAKTIRAMPAFQLNGQFDRNMYKQQLQISGYSQDAWERIAKSDLVVGQFRDAIVNSSFVTEAELSKQQQLINEERVISYAVIPAAKYKADVNITEEAIAAEYEERKTNLFTEQEVDIEYIEIKTQDLADEYVIVQADLEEYYKTVQSRYGEAEQRSARHILLETNALNEESQKELADSLYTQLQQGADFAELAKEYSDDPGSAAQGGELGFFDQNTMVAEFTEATWALNTDEISLPVKTEYGYHIIQLQEIRPSTAPEFVGLTEEQVTELEQEFKIARVEGLLAERADEIAQQVFDANDVLSGVAEANNLELKTQTNINRNTYIGLAAEPAVKTAVFSEELINGTNSDLIAVNNDHAVFLRVTDFREPRQRTLEEVSNEIRIDLEQQAASAKAIEVGTQLQSEVSNPTELMQQATANEYLYTDSLTVKRNQPGIQRDLLTAVFKAPDPSSETVEQGVELSNGDYAVFYLQEIKSSDSQLTDAEKAARITALSNRTGGIELNAYLDSLRSDAKILYPTPVEEQQ